MASEELTILAHTLLAEECGATRHLLMNQESDNGEYPPNQKQPAKGCDNIKSSLNYHIFSTPLHLLEKDTIYLSHHILTHKNITDSYGRISIYKSPFSISSITFTLLADKALLYEATLRLFTVSNRRNPTPKPISLRSRFIIVPRPIPR